MDNSDDFEFKPITEGLGFHKKTNKAKLDVSDSLPGRTLPNSPIKARDVLGKSQFTKLGEEKIALDPTPTRSSRPTNKTTPNFQMPSTTTFIEEAKAPAAYAFSKEEVSVVLPAIFFDTIVVVGLTGLFLFATFLVAKLDPVTVLRMIPTDPMTALGFVVLVASVIQGYLLIARSFFSSTLGEWAFEVEVGTREEQESALYPLRIILRSLVTMMTGLVLLPLLSLIMGQDLAGRISGVSLRRG